MASTQPELLPQDLSTHSVLEMLVLLLLLVVVVVLLLT